MRVRPCGNSCDGRSPSSSTGPRLQGIPRRMRTRSLSSFPAEERPSASIDSHKCSLRAINARPTESYDCPGRFNPSVPGPAPGGWEIANLVHSFNLRYLHRYSPKRATWYRLRRSRRLSGVKRSCLPQTPIFGAPGKPAPRTRRRRTHPRQTRGLLARAPRRAPA